MKTLRLVCVCCLLLTLSPQLFAQSQITTGVVQGTVLDPSGAVVAGASVEANNPDTNFTRSLTTDSNGRFVFLALPPGAYKVTISAKGFATVVQQNVHLTVGQAISLNIPLKVSSTAEQIVVTDTPTLDPTKTEVSSTLAPVTVSTTPVLGRKFEDLLTLTPGVGIVQGPDGDEISFAGQRGTFNNISLDGGDYNNGFFGEQMGGQRAAIDITMDAVQEFQVVASGATAEFGRTAGAIVNVVTKSGTNNVHGSVFHFQRLEALSSDTSDGKPLKNFSREQFGGTIGGPIKKDKMFFFGAFEQILANLTRDNLSTQLGSTPCPVTAPTITANEALINANPDCQRLALTNFIQNTRGQAEGLPVKHPIRNSAALAKYDWNITPRNKLSASFNFDYSKNENQTFDVPTYGDSANGTEGPSKIQAYNANLLTTVSPTQLNELHFTYGRENRPRGTTASKIPADTGIGFAPSFRFGNPFFLEPTIDEIFWRTQIRDNYSIVHGSHNVKFGGEWIHSRNVQTFRGFFTGRYLLDSVTGFLRYASPAAPGGFGPGAAECATAAGAISFVTLPSACPAGSSFTAGPLLFYLQDGLPTGLENVPPGASDIANQDYALFVQDKWQVTRNFTLNYGVRWEAQIFPDPVIGPSKTAYGQYLSNPLFPSDGTLHNQKAEFQPRVGFAWDLFGTQKSVLRANAGIYDARQNMLSEVSSITTNGVQQYTIYTDSGLARQGFTPTPPVWPNDFPVPAATGTIPAGAGVHVFDRNYANPRIYTWNVGFEQEMAPSWSFYTDLTWSKGVHITRFFNYNTEGFFSPSGAFIPGTTNGAAVAPFPALGDVYVLNSQGKALYRGLTVGMRKRFSRHYQLEWNYVLSEDLDDDSNERDPFTDRRLNPRIPSLDYHFSDRDQRHKFNLYSYSELPYGINLNLRLQAHTPQPITAASCLIRNCAWKDTAYTSFDWRVARPFKVGEGKNVIPTVEMFNTFNNKNNVNPLTSAALFDFSGFLRAGVGDPRQVQLAVKFTF
ncbi:MAG: TonB-dependent receptor [Acidobacteriia bacterium]|nr:TonB-dependent receptor [Terriglobia bacterium]